MADDSAPLPLRTQVRDVLDGQVDNGTHAVVIGAFVEVITAGHEQSGLWARGLFVDDTGAVKFWLFPRAFMRTDRKYLDGATQVVVNARVSVSESPALLVNHVSRSGLRDFLTESAP
ncbi:MULTISPECIES: hypothetical protein [unclassified Rhodococcus (in: high G+C Gram-positive bacteria)]|uniref:hypothetical protein n=1 Tax=unclassified Rhodococcus (in: high G+C Gram-positive bacteria) TaxID=192944 RepID=UPI0006F586A5|nr:MULTISPECIES: hypothetical protein [unclassified Rhodococcus (in: high G+C Gram-positive bacteria)]KQU28407.1 hypothetical protein ASG69_10355 [Rhodococcus sp. Leaf225]KQU46513.1 hypothetical protein ASH03_07385 [Rhodococcus sp. Leaf258]